MERGEGGGVVGVGGRTNGERRRTILYGLDFTGSEHLNSAVSSLTSDMPSKIVILSFFFK